MDKSPGASTRVLEVRGLQVSFDSRSGWFGESRRIRAVDGLSFDLHAGETLGLVGESGCGKSSAAKAILRIIRPDAGTIRLNISSEPASPCWLDLTTLEGGELRGARRHLQMIFQDPYASLNPRMTFRDIIAEPLRVFRQHPRRELLARVLELMDEVGLDPKFSRRYPHEFSGGQRQRIGIARALALNPKVVICDEPVSALDVSIRSQVLNLLMELQERRGLAYLFIAHDLSVVKRISHRVAVMYLGKIVELAPHHAIYRTPLHPYTEALLSAVPIPDPDLEARRPRIPLAGEIPSPTGIRTGCDFAGRCPKVLPQCRVIVPALKESAPGHEAACLLTK